MYGLDELPPSDVEPNVFYEPRTATAPFYVVAAGAGEAYWVGEAFSSRAEAEECARQKAEAYDQPYHVLGAVSISSVPKPLPVKASTRALV